MEKNHDIIGVAQNDGGKYGGQQFDTAGAGYITSDQVSILQTLQAFFHSAALAERTVADDSTLTAAALTPQGEIVHASLGDSPLLAFVVDGDNKVISADILNVAHNAFPHALNVINRHLDNHNCLALSREISEEPDEPKFHGSVKLKDLLEKGQKKGERAIIVAASDGLLDGVSSAPWPEGVEWGDWLTLERHMRSHPEDTQAAWEAVRENEKNALAELCPYIETVLQAGGNAQDIADALVNAQVSDFQSGETPRAKAPERRDNTSASVIIADPRNLPGRPVVGMVADGIAHGETASHAILDAFKQPGIIQATHAVRDRQVDAGMKGNSFDRPQTMTLAELERTLTRAEIPSSWQRRVHGENRFRAPGGKA